MASILVLCFWGVPPAPRWQTRVCRAVGTGHH